MTHKHESRVRASCGCHCVTRMLQCPDHKIAAVLMFFDNQYMCHNALLSKGNFELEEIRLKPID
jgi:hypothetical protein